MIYYETYGQGKPILYLHGWGASGAIFKPVVNNLQNYLNVTVDFAGFGNSPPPPKDGFTVFDYACQLAEFLQEKNFGKATVVAHSFGCRIAMILAVDHPELVDKTILFAPAGLRRFSLKRWLKIRLYKAQKRLGLIEKKQSGSADYQATKDELKSTFVKVVNQDLSRIARKIRCKTLIVAARQDTAVPYKDAKRLNKLIKTSELVGIDGDHFALFYSPAAFAKIVKIFMEEQC